MGVSARDKNPAVKVASSVAFGLVSGFVSSVLLQPLDRLKTLSQQQALSQINVFQRTKSIIQCYGVLGLWRGIVPTLMRVVPGVALYFGLVEIGQVLMFQNRSSPAANLMLGSTSRVLAVCLLMPATVIKTRFESNVYRDASVLSAARSVVQQCGFSGLYKGIVPTLMRDAPFSGLYLAFYRQYLKFLIKSEEEHAPARRFASGVLAGVMACAVTQPFDIMKTHVQLYPTKFKSLTDVIGCLYKDGGLRSYFNGFWLRASRRTAMAALSWTVFDELSGLRSHKEI